VQIGKRNYKESTTIRNKRIGAKPPYCQQNSKHLKPITKVQGRLKQQKITTVSHKICHSRAC